MGIESTLMVRAWGLGWAPGDRGGVRQGVNNSARVVEGFIGRDFRCGFGCLWRSRHTSSVCARASECFGNAGRL